MTEAEVIVVMRKFLEEKFPKKCSVCARTYADLKDYLLNTKHIGRPISYDADIGAFQPTRPMGAMSLANCSCGNTLAIDSKGMNPLTFGLLMAWLSGEMIRRGQSPSEILEDLRRAIDEATLAAPSSQ